MVVSIATDVINGDIRLPRPFRRDEWSSSSSVLQSTRHYYTSSDLFEQSLDVYRLALPAAGCGGEGEDEDPPPIVALVVGSAWLGHRSFVYSGTSWWNSR